MKKIRTETVYIGRRIANGGIDQRNACIARPMAHRYFEYHAVDAEGKLIALFNRGGTIENEAGTQALRKLLAGVERDFAVTGAIYLIEGEEQWHVLEAKQPMALKERLHGGVLMQFEPCFCKLTATGLRRADRILCSSMDAYNEAVRVNAEMEAERQAA